MKKKENQLQQKEKPIASKKSVRFSPSLRVSECYKYDALTQQLCQSSRQPPPPLTIGRQGPQSPWVVYAMAGGGARTSKINSPLETGVVRSKILSGGLS